MKIVTTFHQPSSVLASLKCRLSAHNIEHLVVAKLNRIEVYSLQPTGIKFECSLEIYGKVTSIRAVPIPKSTRQNLVVMLAHPDPELIFISYAETGDDVAELQPTHQLSLYERTPRPAEYFNDILVHPSGKLAVVSCYVGKIKVINLKAGRYRDDFDALLPELNIFSLSFLPIPDDEYVLAILHFDHQQRIQLLARDIELEETQLSTFPSTHLYSTVISEKTFPYPADSPPRLIPVYPRDLIDEEDSDDDQVMNVHTSFLGGLLVVGGRNLLLYELVNSEGREKQRGKRRRLEERKKSRDPLEKAKAREKEAEREGKRRKPRSNVPWPWSDFAAWCPIGGEPSKFILGDSYGKLALLSLDNLQDMGLVLIPLGEVSPPTSLTYLTNQVLYVGSHMGDSQLVQLTPTPNAFVDKATLPIPSEVHTVQSSFFDVSTSKKGKGRAISPTFDMEIDDEAGDLQESGNVVSTKGSYITVLENFKNIAPILDACLVDMGGGQRQIVTCSGGKNAGSMKVVRNGADFQEFVNIPGVQHVLKIWNAKSRLEDVVDSFLLLSFHDSSRLVKIRENEGNLSFSPLGDDAMEGLRTREPTIAFSNVARRVRGQDGKARYMNSSLVVQVTPSGANLLELDEGLQIYMPLDRWDVKANAFEDPNAGVVAASINASQVALAISGGKIVLLNVAEDRKLRVVVSTIRTDRQPEISAISCTPLNPTREFSQYILVSYWDSKSIEVFTPSETGFLSICKTLPLPSLVSSLLLYNFGSDQSPKGLNYHPYLLAGLSDGSVATFAWQDKQLKDRKIISLGHAPVSLVVCRVDTGIARGDDKEDAEESGNGTRTVIAAGNRAIVFAHERNRLVHSPVLLKNIVAVSPLNTHCLPSSLIVASEDTLHIGKIKDLNKLHIRSIPFGFDNPRKVAYQPLLKAFGVAFTRTEPGRIGEEDVINSSFRLVDDTTFEVLARFNCDPEEEVTSVIPFAAVVDDALRPFFIVGTFIYHPEETEPESGRLLLISVVASTNPRSPKQAYRLSLAASTKVRGCVYALTSTASSDKTKPRFIAAVNSSVMLFQFNTDKSVSPPILELFKVAEWNHNYLVTSLGAVGEHVFAGDQISSVSLLKVGEERFQTVARDYGPRWPVSVEAIDEKNVIGANDALNLFTFALSRNLERNVLECTGNYHIADLVTKIIRGSLTTADKSEDSNLEPEEMFFTSSGRIGVIINANNKTSLHLTELQRNLATIIPNVGGISHARFRAPKNTRGRSDADQASFGFLDGDFLEQLLHLLDSQETVEKIWEGQTEPEKLSVSVDEMRRVLEDLQSHH